MDENDNKDTGDVNTEAATESVQAEPQAAPESAQALTQDEKNWGMFCHIAVFVGFVIPFGNIVAPLVLWLMKKQEMPFVDYHGKEVVNFQLTMLIAVLVSGLLVFVVIGVFMLWAIGIFALVVTIIGIIKANQGEYYQYPFAIRFLK